MILQYLFNFIASEKEEDKNQRKWQKIIDKTFITKIDFEENNMEEKINDKFQNDQEIKNIINELYIKQKNSQYLFNKQRQILKKFNLQEKIQLEETRVIKENEEAKNNDIFNDAIQKLAARHMLGFEPIIVIRQKILAKIQAKYNINAENMEQLTNYFESNEDSDKELEIGRKEKQIEVLENILSDSKQFDYKEVDKATIIQVKNEIKNYEKDLVIKASQNDDELNNIEELMIKEQEENNLNKMQEEENFDSIENEYDDDLKIKISNYINIGETEEDEKKFELSIEEFKKEIIDEIKDEMKNEIKDDNKIEEDKICNIDEYNEFNSSILNNLAWKLKYQKKLSDFDNQILLYVTHSIIDELNCAKKNKRDFDLIISPQELMKFLKQFHLEKAIENFSSPNDIPKKSVSASPNTNSQI